MEPRIAFRTFISQVIAMLQLAFVPLVPCYAKIGESKPAGHILWEDTQ
jgi:hypothetical protein